jgi:CHAT domain-containing protein/predicted negative regulator of RcsB-dependent stress response
MTLYLCSKGRTKACRYRYVLYLVYFFVSTVVIVQIQAEAYIRETTSEERNYLTATEPPAQSPQQLIQGQPLRREITVGKSDVYQIHLSSNDFLSVIMDAYNTELAITVFGPESNNIREFRTRRLGPTPLSLISSAPGAYTLEIRMLERRAVNGSYEIQVDQLRAAIAQDSVYLLAEKSIAEADRLKEEWTSTSLLRAINKYEEAGGFLRQVGNLGEEAYALKNIGEIYTITGQNHKAINYYDKALELSNAAGNIRLKIETLNDLGRLNLDLGNKQLVLDYSNQAQALSKQIGYFRGEARAINNLGGLFAFIMGDKQKGLSFFDQSEKLWQTTGDLRGRAESLTNLGYAHTDLGNLKQALHYFNEALSFWQAAKHRRGEALALTALGVVHCSIGDMQKALDNHSKALNLFHTIGDRTGEAATLNGQAYVYNSLGEARQALELYKKALQLYKEASRRTGELATLGQIGRVYESLGEYDSALSYHTQRLELSRSLGNDRAESHTLRDIGLVFDSKGDKQKALDYYNQALSVNLLNDRRGRGYTLNCVGYIYERTGEKDRALQMYRQALELLRAVEDCTGEIQTLHNIARVARDTGDLVEARNQGEALLGMIENLRTKVINQDFRASYFASAHQHYELYTDILMRLHRQNPTAGYAAAALEISERARARVLLDLLNEAGIDIRQGVDSDLLQQEHELQQSLNSKAELQVRLASGRPTEEQRATVKKEIAKLTTQYEEVRARIRATSPQYATLTQPHTLKLSEIQNLLDENTLLLEYLLGDEKSYLWVITPNSLATFELPARSTLEQEAGRLYELLVSLNQFSGQQTLKQRRLYQEGIQKGFSETAARLSEMLLAPAAAQLKAKRLIIVADGALLYVPFAALPAPADPQEMNDIRQPLVITHEIVNLPSISIIGAIRKETQRCCSGSKTLAILADPVFEKNDPRIKPGGVGANVPLAEPAQPQPSQRLFRSRGAAGNMDEKLQFQRLPEANTEARAIASLLPRSELRLAVGFDANVSMATSAEMRHYRIVHFATHALIYGVHPQLYGIVLSLFDQRGNPQDGFLRLNEIYNLKLPTDLIVLSACQTAIGKHIEGEGLVGLTRGFIYVGAKRVVASLWKVNDKASAELMKYFYEAMLGKERLRPSAALRAAQIKMWQQSRWSFPYYWAAFLLQGEWQ